MTCAAKGIDLLGFERSFVGSEDARAVPRLIETKDDPETRRPSCFLETEFDPSLKVSEVGLEEGIEFLLRQLPVRDMAPVTRFRIGGIENFSAKRVSRTD